MASFVSVGSYYSYIFLNNHNAYIVSLWKLDFTSFNIVTEEGAKWNFFFNKLNEQEQEHDMQISASGKSWVSEKGQTMQCIWCARPLTVLSQRERVGERDSLSDVEKPRPCISRSLFRFPP